MLNLLDPIELEGITLYRDDEDVRKFYWLPDRPTIARNADGSPAFQFLLIYDNREGVEDDQRKDSGHVLFRTTLALDDAQRAAILTQLEDRLKDEKQRGYKPFGKKVELTEPLLATPQWVDGSVELSTFDVAEDSLVRFVGGSTAPNLVGELSASLNLHLDAVGAAVFWGAFKSGTLPIVISCGLTYKARVPAAKLVIHAEREKVVERLWEGAQAFYLHKPTLKLKRFIQPLPMALTRHNLPAIRAATGLHIQPMLRRKRVTETITNTVTVDLQFAEGGGEEADAEMRTKLLGIAGDLLTQNIIPMFFSAQGFIGEVTEAEEGEELLELKEDYEESLEPFHLEFNEEFCVDRKVNPNAPVTLVMTEEEMANAFLEVPADHPLFRRMQVTASTVGVDFERDGISAIQVYFDYHQQDDTNGSYVRDSADRVIRSAAEAAEWKVEHLARDPDGNSKYDYKMRTKVSYSENLPESNSDWTEQTDSYPLIRPAGLGAVRIDLRLTARSETVDKAVVDLRHRSSSGALFEETKTLTASAPEVSWFQFTGDFDAGIQEPAYEFRTSYYTPTGGKVVTPWTTTREQTLEIASPFERILHFSLFPRGWDPTISKMVGQLIYEDAAHDYRVIETFQLTSGTDTKDLSVPILAYGPEEASVELTIVRSDSSTEVVRPATTGEGMVFVGPEVSEFLEVMLNPVLLDFETDLRLAMVVLTYRDASGAEVDREILNFRKGGTPPETEPYTWKVALAPGAPRTYDLDITYVGHDPATSANVHREGIDDAVILMDRTAPTG